MATELCGNSDTASQEFVELVEHAIEAVCRRHRIPHAERLELGSWVWLKILDKEKQVLRHFEGRSSLTTYLTIAIRRLLLDWRRAQWGKWRPSSAANRSGPLAVRIEELLHRDRYEPREVLEILRTEQPGSLTETDLSDLMSRLPCRLPRQFLGEQVLDQLSAASESPEDLLFEQESLSLLQGLEKGLSTAFSSLGLEEQRILRMRFKDGLSVARIAEDLDLDKKWLYRHIAKILGSLRTRLASSAIKGSEICRLLGRGIYDIHLDMGV